MLDKPCFKPLFAVLLALPTVTAAAAASPTIRLFPTTVMEDIKQTGSVAREMESGLQQVITRLDQQQQIYVDSKCDGASLDPGCGQITRQLGATYLEMLEAMDQKLPDMEKAVNNTHDSLQRRLRSELGKGMTPWQLQEALAGRSHSDGDARPALRGRSGMRLSERFSQYYQLVAQSGNRSGSSLAVIAADVYLDMAEASDLIARTREEISRATLMEELNQSFGTVTPEMQEVVAGVKSILFGEASDETPVAGPPPGSIEQEYVSPLQL